MANIKLSFNDLVEIIRLKEVEKLSSRKIAKRFGVSKSTVNYFLAKDTFPEFWEEYDKRPVAGGSYITPEEEQGEFNGKTFIFLSAQNNTYHHEKVIDSLEHYAKFRNAELVVGTFSYNKNGFQNGTKGDSTEWIDPRLLPYVCNKQMKIAEGLIWCGERNILPTTKNPLSTLKSYCGADSIIVPHAKHAADSVATPSSYPTKLMYTTGCGTLSNYIEKSAGQDAKWTHTYGAVIVEVDEEGDWFVRQINCCTKTGVFQDLNYLVTPEGVKEGLYNVEGIQWGDLHIDKLTDELKDAMFGEHEGSMAECLMPSYQFAHDSFNFSDPNGHHTKKDPYYRFRSFIEGAPTIAEEIEKTYEVLEDMARIGKVIVVESNHDLHLEQYLKEGCYKEDPRNAEFFLELQLENYRAMRRKEKLQTFKTACELQCGALDSDIIFLKTDESFNLCGIECGSHSHLGPNGARGSIAAFANMGVRFNIGHSHSWGIKNGVFQAGVSMVQEDSGYAKGPSSWTITHIITYSSGKRTGVTMKWSEKQQKWKWKA